MVVLLLYFFLTGNINPEPYLFPEDNGIIYLEDTLYAHQRILFSPLLKPEVNIILKDSIINIPIINNTFEIPYLNNKFSTVEIEITTSHSNYLKNITISSERWMEIYLDEDLQFTILWEGARPYIYNLISSGKSSSPTSAAHSHIFEKLLSATFYDGGEMKWWMSIQRTYNVTVITDSEEEKFFPMLENGTHSPLSGTYHQVGRQASHGCVRNPLAKIYWDNLQTNDRVEMHYRSSGSSYNPERINPAWRFVWWQPILEVDSSFENYVTETFERISKEYNLE